MKPSVDKYCIRCHKPGAEGTEKSGFMMVTYADLMKGEQYGAVVKPGDSFTSALVMLVEGRAHPSLRMPHDKGDKPTTLIRKQDDVTTTLHPQSAAVLFNSRCVPVYSPEQAGTIP